MDIKNSNTEQEEHVAGNSGGGLFFLWGGVHCLYFVGYLIS